MVLKISSRCDAAGTTDQLVNLTFNGSTSGYSTRELLGNGSSGVASLSWSSAAQIYLFQQTAATATSSTFGNIEAYIPNYTSANYKSVSCDGAAENNASANTNRVDSLSASLWSNTAAITSIALTSQSGNFVQYSTFYLYGVAALGTTPTIAPKATGGDTILTDGTYWYHTFNSSGTFTPVAALSCDYLVVAGGGGGGAGNGAGGGAGGLRSTVTATGGGGSLESKLSVTSSTGYTVTIGAGGAGGISNGQGTNGSNSVFATITSTGGGGGGSYNAGGDTFGGKTGGSGGGGGTNGTTSALAGSGTANQGYAGGAGGTGLTAGGGGGAGATGSAASGTTPGAGGNGVATVISGSSVTYAGGGGGASGDSSTGAAGGSGGGGAGSASSAVAGTANRGGGGGGKSTGGNGAAGGSGIVIIRYAV